ncbi:unnamed protein product [Vitrella brassicaformis CCMP3155]|uniref:TLDc domain-containing protein n=1 Tax=Vitrella brassicaformis (strain CCMP3155) TaxID=1169540 RepID=A0A0G4G274_VITBC|nr:unnamed protein product [Vitrella brassicaformis CCMP3155]|eukprot:CEM21928.1 unnamed protein product [Vitrella brassicaformis CCMP3155]
MVALRGMMLLALAVTLALCSTPTSTTHEVRRLQDTFPVGTNLSQSEYEGLRGLLEAKNDTKLTTLYRATWDGTFYGDLLDLVENKTDVVIVIRKDQYLFAVYIKDGIQTPANATKMHIYKSEVSWFSLAGHFDTPTEIKLWQSWQEIRVVGRVGDYCDRIPSAWDIACGSRVLIGGRLMLGLNEPYYDDGWIDSGFQDIPIEYVPDGYEGVRGGNSGDPTDRGDRKYAWLAGSFEFRADELEVLQVYPPQPTAPPPPPPPAQPPAGLSLSDVEYGGLLSLLKPSNDTMVDTLHRASVD